MFNLEKYDKKVYDIIFNRLQLISNYKQDQFLLACSCKYNSLKYIIIMLMLDEINPNYKTIVIMNNIIYEIKDIKSNFYNLIKSNNFNNIEYIIKFLNVLKIDSNKINEIAYIYYYNNIDYEKIISNVLDNYENVITYKMPNKIYPLDECPICMNEKMKYIWLKCGHNVCKNCYEILTKNQSSIKCPYCNTLISLY